MKRNVSISKALLFIIVLALILRLTIFFLIEPYTIQGFHLLFDGEDSAGYYSLAIGIIQNGQYGLNDDFISTIRTPGYPIFISLLFYLFGNHIWVVILFQICIDVLLIIFINKFTSKMWNRIAGFIASFLWAIEPFAILFPNYFLSDSIFAFTIFLSFYYLFVFLNNKKLFTLFLLSLCLVLGIFIRPIAIYLVPIFLCISFIKMKGLSPQRKISFVLIFGLMISIFIGGWIIRNKIVYDYYFFSTSGNFNSLILYAAPVLAEVEKKSDKEIYIREIKKVSNTFQTLSKHNYYEFSEKVKKRAFGIIKEHPMIFIKKYFWGIIDTYFSIERTYIKKITHENDIVEIDYIDSIENKGLWYTILELLKKPGLTELYTFLIIPFFILIYFCSIGGIIVLLKKKEIFILILILSPILYFTLITGPAGLGRFKFPVIPFYLILSSIFISHIVERKVKNLIDYLQLIQRKIYKF